MRQWMQAVVMVGVLGAAAPGAADAARVSAADGNVTYLAAPGEVNDVSLADFAPFPGGEEREGTLWLQETGTAKLVTSGGCVVVQKGWVRCAIDANRDERVTLRLGDQNDVFTEGRYQAGNVDVYGEAGNDEITASPSDAPVGEAHVDGGDGNDNLYVGNRSGEIFGGRGDDLISSYGAVFDAGPGNDATSWAADFGSAGRPIVLGPGDDTLSVGGGGFASRTTAYGTFIEWGDDEDLLDGGPGVDTVGFSPYAGFENSLGFQFMPLMVDLSHRQTGIEIVDQRGSRPDGKGGSLGTLLLGADGYDVLRGGDGPDIIVPGRRADWVSAGPGADKVITVDGAIDHISCGTGTDQLRSDKVDVVWAKDCERPKVTFP